MKKSCSRRKSGSIAALAFAALVPLIALIAGFAVDCMHVNDERGGLQRATDAGALAGALAVDQWTASYPTTGTDVSGVTAAEPVDDALRTTRMNFVDGRLVSTQHDGPPPSILVTATLLPPGGNAFLPVYTQCQVSATMHINSIFAKLFGNFGQTVSTNSIAVVVPIDQTPVNAAYPTLLGNTNKPPRDPLTGKRLGNPLSTTAVGTTFYWSYGALSNAQWTDVSSSSASTVNTAQTTYGTPGANGQTFSPGQTGGTPSITLNTTAISSTDSLQDTSEQTLANTPVGTLLMMPVTSTLSNSGGYTASQFVVIKFLGTYPTGSLHVKGINSVFSGQLMPPAVMPGVNTSGSSTIGLTTPLTARLVQ